MKESVCEGREKKKEKVTVTHGGRQAAAVVLV